MITLLSLVFIGYRNIIPWNEPVASLDTSTFDDDLDDLEARIAALETATAVPIGEHLKANLTTI